MTNSAKKSISSSALLYADACRHAFAISPHDTREVFLKLVVFSHQREQGMPGARCTRGLVCKIVRKGAHEHTGSAEALRHSLRNGFTAYFVLSPATGLSCHRRPQEASLPGNLTPASGRQDHTTSPSASAPFVIGASASTASRPASVTIASRPSVGRDDEEYKGDLGGPQVKNSEIRNFFWKGGTGMIGELAGLPIGSAAGLRRRG
jgi:hypothetical protein